MSIRLTHIHDPEKNYLIRMCMSVEDLAKPYVPSTVKQCAECGCDVWYSEVQVVPVPEGVVIDGEVVLCTGCTLLHQAYQEGPINWAGPAPT